MPKPLISVITSIFRSENYLESFLTNVEKMEFLDKTEIILSFSMPSAKEIQILKVFRKQLAGSLVIILNKRRLNIAQASNQIIKRSRGNFLAIWNVDDKREPDSLKLQMEKLEHSHADICVGPYIKSKLGQDGILRQRLVDVPTIQNKYQLFHRMNLGPFFMIRKTLVKSSGPWDEQFISGGDFDWAVRLAANGKLCSVTNILGTYRDLGQGMSTSSASLQPVEREVILLRYGAFYKLNPKLIPFAVRYDIGKISVGSRKIDLATCFPNYEAFLETCMKLEINESPVESFKLKKYMLYYYWALIYKLKKIRSAMRVSYR